MASAYVRMVYRTTRWSWEGRAHFDAVVASREPVVTCFWHSRILMMCPIAEQSKMPIAVMISNNRDGELISRTIARFGATTIRGSTRDTRKNRDKGGGVAFREALEFLRSGGTVALTPDGPRGPRMRAQDGVAALSVQSCAPVLPLAFSTRNARVMSSWDRFIFALPFGRGAYVCGAPIAAPGNAEPETVEAHRLEIERALTFVARRADALVGRVTPPPDDEPQP